MVKYVKKCCRSELKLEALQTKNLKNTEMRFFERKALLARSRMTKDKMTESQNLVNTIGKKERSLWN